MLTPIDIQNHTLKTSVSGYNKKDTEEFLASILDSYETLFRENRTLKEKITSLSEGIQYYKQMENTLQKALILAEKTSTETQEAAKTQADSVIKDAQAKADSIIRDIKAEADSTKAGAKALVKESEEKAARLIREAEEEAESVTREAQEKAETVIKEAEEKAALITSDAEKYTSDIKSQAQDELDGIRVNAIKLVQDYEKYCSQVKKLVKAQLAMLESDDYKLHVTELSIDNNIVKNNSLDKAGAGNADMDKTNADSTEKNSTEADIVNMDTDNNQNNSEEEIKDSLPEEDTGKDSSTEKFSWNSDGSEYLATEEQDSTSPSNPFTFIDPE